MIGGGGKIVLPRLAPGAAALYDRRMKRIEALCVYCVYVSMRWSKFGLNLGQYFRYLTIKIRSDLDHTLHALRYDMYLSACKVWSRSELIMIAKYLKY